MFRKLIILILLFIFLSRLPLTLVEAGVDTEEVHQIETIEALELDPRAIILRDYLAQYNSPLQYHAQDFIDASDTYNIDWKLVPAISGVESTFGKAISGGYNGWGWGIYGGNRLGFESWRDGIFTVTKGLKEGYIDQGLTDPYSMNRKYAASPTWGQKVSYFMNDLEKFANNSKNIEGVNLDESQAGINNSAALKQILLTSLPKTSAKPGFLNI